MESRLDHIQQPAVCIHIHQLVRVQHLECPLYVQPVADSGFVHPRGDWHELRIYDPLFERKHDEPRLQYAAVNGVPDNL